MCDRIQGCFGIINVLHMYTRGNYSTQSLFVCVCVCVCVCVLPIYKLVKMFIRQNEQTNGFYANFTAKKVTFPILRLRKFSTNFMCPLP